MSRAADGNRELEAAKSRLSAAKQSENFATRMAESAAEKMAAAEAYLKAAKEKLKAAEKTMDAARADVCETNNEVSRCRKEVAYAQSSLEAVEERWEVIDIEGSAANSTQEAQGASKTVDLVSNNESARSQLDDASVVEINSVESHSELEDAPVIATEFLVSGSSISNINGTYRMRGTYPDCECSDGLPMYTKLGTLGGSDVTFTIYRHDGLIKQRRHDGNGSYRGEKRRWFISVLKDINAPGSSEDEILYYTSIIHSDGGLPPQCNWRKDGAAADSSFKILPLSGLDQQGREIEFDNISDKDKIQNTRVFVQGCGVSEVNGLYEIAELHNGIPIYAKGEVRLSLQTQSNREETKRWCLERKEPLQKYFFCPISPMPPGSKNVVIPSTGWKRAAGVKGAAPRIFLIKSKQDNCTVDLSVSGEENIPDFSNSVFVGNGSESRTKDNDSAPQEESEENCSLSELGDSFFFATEFAVEGSEILGINGTYKICGSYPDCRYSDGIPMYSKQGSLGEQEVTFVLCRHRQTDAYKWGGKGRRWVISVLNDIDPPGSLVDNLFYFTQYVGDNDLIPPQNKWRKNESALEPSYRVFPTSGMDRNGREIEISQSLHPDELVTNRVLIEGSSTPNMDGLFELDCLTFTHSSCFRKGEFSLHLETADRLGNKRWDIVQNSPYRIHYQSPIFSPTPSAEVMIPNSGWKMFMGGACPKLKAFFIKHNQRNSTRKRSRRS